jgi:hypothetical protein
MYSENTNNKIKMSLSPVDVPVDTPVDIDTCQEDEITGLICKGNLYVDSLYIGDYWRIVTTKESKKKKLTFEYLDDDGVTWLSAFPFIRGRK